MWKKGNRIKINELHDKKHLLIKFDCGLCGVENEILFFDYSNNFFKEYPYYVWENEFGCPHCEKSNYHKIEISIDDDLIINIQSDFNEFEKNINESLYYSTEIKDKNKYTIEFPLELDIIEQYLNENHYLVFGKSMIGILDILNSKSISENEIIKNLIYSNLITIFETYISDLLISKVDSNKDLQIKVVEDYNIFSGIKIDKKNIYNGDTGFITKIKESNNGPSVLYVSIRGESIAFTDKQSIFLDLAYCMTPHKAQGSEANNTLIIIPEASHFMLSQEWLLTAITRAKNKCIAISTTGAINKIVLISSIEKRTTLIGIKGKNYVSR